jgi:hypothetical protein
MGFSYGQQDTVNPGRHRRQKAVVEQRAAGVREAFERRREEAAAALRKEQFNRACIQAVIVGIKTAMHFTVAECEQPVWPEGPWYKPRTFKPEFFERAMRYFNPAISEEFFHKQLQSFKEFWQIEHWIGGRYTIVENLEFDGPWYRTPNRHDVMFPNLPEEFYYFDMALIKLVKENDEDGDSWHYWKLKGDEEDLPVAPSTEPVTSTDKNTSEGDALTSPEIIWNGNSSEHFTPRIRKRFWRRVIAALTNQKP